VNFIKKIRAWCANQRVVHAAWISIATCVCNRELELNSMVESQCYSHETTKTINEINLCIDMQCHTLHLHSPSRHKGVALVRNVDGDFENW
jgi:hypothetical protein